MDQDFSDFARSGTAPIQNKQTAKLDPKGKAALSVSSPIRTNKQPSRPKTSSTSDLADMNMALRANRSINALAASERNEREQLVEEDGNDDSAAASFRRDQQESEYLQLVENLRQGGGGGGVGGGGGINLGNSPAARNAWGSRQGPRGEEARTKKSSLSAYLQNSVPSVLQSAHAAQARSKAAAAAAAAAAAVATTASPAAGATANKERPSNAQKAYARHDVASVYGGLRLGTPGSQRPRNPAVVAAQHLGGEREREREREKEREREREREREALRPRSKLSLYGSTGNPPAHKPSSSSSSLRSSPPSVAAPAEVSLEQSAAMAYLGGAPAVLRSSTTRSRSRLHVQVAATVASQLEAGEAELGPRPQTHSGQSSGRAGDVASSSSGNRGYGMRATGREHEDEDEATEVTEEIVLDTEGELDALLESAPSPRLLRMQSLSRSVAASAAPPSQPHEREREWSPSRGSQGGGRMDRAPPSPKSRRELGAGLQRRTPPPELVLNSAPDAAIIIGDPADATRRLERPKSRKPHLSASAGGGGNGDEQGSDKGQGQGGKGGQGGSAKPKSAGAVRLSEQDRAPSLRRMSSFTGHSLEDRDPAAEHWTEEKPRPPSRQSSAFPVHLAEPAAKAEAAESGSQRKGATRPWGQPVDLDDLDSDDEIFTRRDKQPYSPRHMQLKGLGQAQEEGRTSPMLSSRRGSHASLGRRGSDPVADGFTALGIHDEGQWPFPIQVNYVPAQEGPKHTPRHIAELERRHQQWEADDVPDDLSELDLDVRSARSGSPQSAGGGSNRASPSAHLWMGTKARSRDALERQPSASQSRRSSNNTSPSGWSKNNPKAFDDPNAFRAATPTHGLYADDESDDGDDDDHSIMTEQEGALEASHATFSLESSLPEDFLNLFSVM